MPSTTNARNSDTRRLPPVHDTKRLSRFASQYASLSQSRSLVAAIRTGRSNLVPVVRERHKLLLARSGLLRLSAADERVERRCGAALDVDEAGVGQQGLQLAECELLSLGAKRHEDRERR